MSYSDMLCLGNEARCQSRLVCSLELVIRSLGCCCGPLKESLIRSRGIASGSALRAKDVRGERRRDTQGIALCYCLLPPPTLRLTA